MNAFTDTPFSIDVVGYPVKVIARGCYGQAEVVGVSIKAPWTMLWFFQVFLIGEKTILPLANSFRDRNGQIFALLDTEMHLTDNTVKPMLA